MNKNMDYKVFKNGNFIIIESSNNRDVWEVSVDKMVISRAKNSSAVYDFYDNGDSILTNVALSFLQDESGTAYSESDFENFRTTECGYNVLDIDSITENVESDLNAGIIDVDLCCPSELSGYVYTNGTAGVGAQLTAPANGAFPTQDGVASALGKTYLVQFQTNKRHNGLYELTTLGNGSTKAKLTRIANADETTELYPLKVFILDGTVSKNLTFAQKTESPTIGTSNIVFDQVRTSTTTVTPNVLLADTATSSAITGLTYTPSTLTGFPGIGAKVSKNGAFPTINSVTPFIGMVFLLKDESGADEYMNGLYKLTVNNGTSWSATRYILNTSNINKKVICISNSTCDLYGDFYACDNLTTPSSAIGTDAISFTEVSAGAVDTNFANTNLTFTANRTHDLDGYVLTLDDGALTIIPFDDTSSSYPVRVKNAANSEDRFYLRADGQMYFSGDAIQFIKTIGDGLQPQLIISSNNASSNYGPEILYRDANGTILRTLALRNNNTRISNEQTEYSITNSIKPITSVGYGDAFFENGFSGIFYEDTGVGTANLVVKFKKANGEKFTATVAAVNIP